MKFSTEYDDGPYVFEFGKRREVVSICSGETLLHTVDLNYPKSIDICNKQVILWQSNPPEHTQLEYSGGFKVAAASDIHGQFDLFKSLLINNKIADKEGNWNFATGHFVITGDVFDRGEQVLEALWYLYDLEKQAQAAGGRLHVLLGNHEVMVLNGDLRYLHPKYFETAKLLDRPYEDLFLKNSVLGDWIRSRPVLVKVNGMLFAHGGFHPELKSKNLSVDEINKVFKANLIKKEVNGERSELGTYLHKRNGPIWYRGYFKEDAITEEQIDGLLEHFSVEHIVVGHTTQSKVLAVHDSRVIAIDAGMKNGEYGEVLFWDSGQFSRGTLSGQRLPLKNFEIKQLKEDRSR